jgi:hypothetical protein
MATIKERLGPEAAEELRTAVLLQSDPMSMNRTVFERYLAAKGELMLEAMDMLGLDRDSALSIIATEVYTLDAAWREEAKRINLAKRS